MAADQDVCDGVTVIVSEAGSEAGSSEAGTGRLNWRFINKIYNNT